MDGGAPHIRLTIDNSTPVALSDFVANFVGIGNQFEKMIARDFPLLRTEGEFYVKEVRAGSIEADLVTWVASGLMVAGTLGVTVADNIARGQAMVQFVKSLRERLSQYFTPGGRTASASKGDLADFYKNSCQRRPRPGRQLEFGSGGLRGR